MMFVQQTRPGYPTALATATKQIQRTQAWLEHMQRMTAPRSFARMMSPSCPASARWCLDKQVLWV